MTRSNLSLNKKSKQYEEVSTNVEQLAPDGGWGWVVCFGAFMVNFIADGTMFSFGIVFIDLLDYFKDSKFKTSIVGSSQLGLSMMMGPVVSILLKRYSCRQVTMAGAIIASVSMVLSIFSPNIEVMIITYGVLTGCGICMQYLTAIIAVGLYFTKRRAIATGIATSGAGVGVFVYGYLIDYLLYMFSWKGTVLIMSGLMLNCAVCGALFRPIRPVIPRITMIDVSSVSSGYGGSSEEGDKFEEIDVDDTDDVDDSGDENQNESDNMCVRNKHSSHQFLNVHKQVESHHGNKFKSAEDIRFISIKEVDPRLHLSSQAVSKVLPAAKTERIAMGLLHPMLRKDIFYSGSVSHLPDYDACGGSMTSFLAQMTRDKSVSNVCESPLAESRSRIKSLYDLSVFKDTIFWLLLFICTFWTVQSIPITYVPGLAISHGIDRSQSSLLISIVGIANTVGRILAGVVNDVFKIRSIVLYLGAFCLGTIVNFVFPFCESFPLIAVCTLGFGLCMAVAVSMRTIVIADLMKIDRLTQTFGLVSFAQGAAFIFNPPIAGTFMDLTGTYMAPFFMTAIFYLLSSVLSLTIVLIQYRQKKRLHSEDNWI